MKQITLPDDENNKFGEVLNYVRHWCSKNQWAVGVGEMAAGAGLIAAGIHIGHIHMGSDLVGTTLGGFNVESVGGGGLGGGVGALAGAILGSIGVATGGVAVGIPAWLVISGGAAIFGAAGYSIGDAVHNFLHPPINMAHFFAGTCLLNIGTALIIDGARRLIKDEAFKRVLSDYCGGVVRLVPLTVEVVADSFDALKRLVEQLSPTGPVDAVGSAATGAAGAAAGAVIGSSVAAGSVTVLGSHAIGGLALSLGLVSAPLWPVVAGGAAGLAVGYAAWNAARHFGSWFGLD